MSTTNYLLSIAAVNADAQLEEAITSIRGSLKLRKDQKPDPVLVAAFLNFQIGMVIAWQIEETKDALEHYLPELMIAVGDMAGRIGSLEDTVDALAARGRGDHDKPF